MQILGSVEKEWVKKKMGVLMNICEGPACQKCSFYVGRQVLDHVSLKDADMTEEAERWELEPKLASLWWTKHFCFRDAGGHHDLHADRATQNTF